MALIAVKVERRFLKHHLSFLHFVQPSEVVVFAAICGQSIVFLKFQMFIFWQSTTPSFWVSITLNRSSIWHWVEYLFCPIWRHFPCYWVWMLTQGVSLNMYVHFVDLEIIQMATKYCTSRWNMLQVLLCRETFKPLGHKKLHIIIFWIALRPSYHSVML